jgi:hypothetical protein
MKVNRKPVKIRAGMIGAGNTFSHVDNDGVDGDFIVMKRNSCFRILKGCGMERADGSENVLLYNVGAKCFGMLPADTLVIPTNAELTING